MTDNPTRYLELLEHQVDDNGVARLDAPIGHDYAGNHEPITEIGVSVPIAENQSHTGVIIAADNPEHVPAEHKGRPVVKTAHAIPDTRIVVSSNPLVTDTLLNTNLFREIDKPSKAHIDKHKDRTAAHKQALAARDKQVTVGNEPAPDANDHPVEG